MPEYLPIPQSVHPSVVDVAAALVEYWPAGHDCVSHEVLDPISDHLPVPQSVHPSDADVAAVVVDFCPAGHS